MTIDIATARALWTKGNDAGEGYATDHADVNEAADELADGGGIVQQYARDGELAIVRRADGGYTAIGDANGAWAVDLTADSCDVATLD